MNLKTKAYTVMEIIAIVLIVSITSLIVFSMVSKKSSGEINNDNEVIVDEDTTFDNNVDNSTANTDCGTYDVKCLIKKHGKQICPPMKVLTIGQKNEVSDCVFFIGKFKEQLAVFDNNGVNRLVGYKCTNLGDIDAKCEYYSVYGDEKKCFNSNFEEYSCD